MSPEPRVGGGGERTRTAQKMGLEKGLTWFTVMREARRCPFFRHSWILTLRWQTKADGNSFVSFFNEEHILKAHMCVHSPIPAMAFLNKSLTFNCSSRTKITL